MKATLFIYDFEAEIIAEGDNGFVLTNKKKETAEDLVERATAMVQDKYLEDLEVEEVTMAKLKKQATTKLAKRLETAEALETKMIQNIFEERGVKSTKRPATGKKAVSKAKKVTDKEIDEKVAEAEAEIKGKSKKGKGAHKNDINPIPEQKKGKAAKEKEAKEVEQPTTKELNALEKNLEAKVTFLPFRADKKVHGTITKVVADKRSGKVYYRIVDSKEGTHHVRTDNESLKFKK